jgi:hypothetical protein
VLWAAPTKPNTDNSQVNNQHNRQQNKTSAVVVVGFPATGASMFLASHSLFKGLNESTQQQRSKLILSRLSTANERW